LTHCDACGNVGEDTVYLPDEMLRLKFGNSGADTTNWEPWRMFLKATTENTKNTKEIHTKDFVMRFPLCYSSTLAPLIGNLRGCFKGNYGEHEGNPGEHNEH
jgi:hypothetical protein